MHKRVTSMAAALALCGATAPACAQDAIQWRVEDGGNGHWYRANLYGSGCWSQHRALAEAAGGHLATITSAAEDALVGSIAPPAFLNIGAVQAPDACEPGCGWDWITGEPWNFSRWDSGQPDGGAWQNHLAWVSSGWHDGTECPPYTGSGYVIEWSADCDSDGIVDYGQILDGTREDLDANGVPDCCDAGLLCGCFADLDRNDQVNSADLAILLAEWGTDGGKFYRHADLAEILFNWGPCP